MEDPNGAAIVTMVFFVVAGLTSLFLYFTPSLVAAMRRHPNAVAIMALNFFLGWTVLGWVGALVWSLTATRRD
jgi:ABC-type transport system involved in cytochrome c biogenesis permease component